MAAHTHKQAKEIFTKPVLDKIAAAIAAVEKETSAEIRVSIKEERDHDEAGLSIEDIAKREFLRLGMDKTADKHGILLFILFEEHKFYVYGDTGIHERVHPETWQDVADTLKEHFKHSHYEQGIQDALKKIVLHVHTAFGFVTGTTRELNNEVIIG